MSPNCKFDVNGYCQYCKRGGHSIHWKKPDGEKPVPKSLFDTLIERYGYVTATLIMNS